MRLVTEFYNRSLAALENGGDVLKIVSMPVRERIGRFKYVKESNIEKEYDEIITELEESLEKAKQGDDD